VKNLEWSRSDAIARLRRDVWRYVTTASVTDDDIPLMAGALLQMPADQVRYLAQLQFILSEAVGRLLHEMPTLIRRLTTTTETEVEASAERIRGPIRWGETYARRGASGRSMVFVTAPTRRAFDTPENLVLAFALRAIADFGARTGWHTLAVAGPAQEVRRRVSEATRWRQSRSLASLDPAPPPPTVLSRVRGGRHRRRYQAALDVVDLYGRFIARLDRWALRNAVERRALLASRDDVLLELECVFDTIRALRDQGWQAPPDALLRPPLVFCGRRADDEVELFYQHAPLALRKGSRYGAIQRVHDFPGAGVHRPDLVLRLRQGAATRWLLFEVKGGTGRGVADYARDAARDLLAYRRDFDSALAGQAAPYGIGYAWGAELRPSADSEIALCTPDTLPDALELLLPSAALGGVARRDDWRDGAAGPSTPSGEAPAWRPRAADIPAGSLEAEFADWLADSPDCEGWGLAWYLAAELCSRFYVSHGLMPEVIEHEGLGYYGIALVQAPCAGRERRELGRMTMSGNVENWATGSPGDHGLELQQRAARGSAPGELLAEVIRFLGLPIRPDRSHAACHHKRRGASFEMVFRLAAHIAMRAEGRVAIWNGAESGVVRSVVAPEPRREDMAAPIVIEGKQSVVVTSEGLVLEPRGLGSLWKQYMEGASFETLISRVEASAGL
jgi:hypothetical protein